MGSTIQLCLAKYSLWFKSKIWWVILLDRDQNCSSSCFPKMPPGEDFGPARCVRSNKWSQVLDGAQFPSQSQRKAANDPFTDCQTAREMDKRDMIIWLNQFAIFEVRTMKMARTRKIVSHKLNLVQCETALVIQYEVVRSFTKQAWDKSDSQKPWPLQWVWRDSQTKPDHIA